ncbi:hypothetical protein ACOSQ3_012354 [Xanthoceras sorbifolium]
MTPLCSCRNLSASSKYYAVEDYKKHETGEGVRLKLCTLPIGAHLLPSLRNNTKDVIKLVKFLAPVREIEFGYQTVFYLVQHDSDVLSTYKSLQGKTKPSIFIFQILGQISLIMR